MGLAQLQHDPTEELLQDFEAPEGVSVLTTNLGYGTLFIDLLEVHPSVRSCGLGKQALKRLCEEADAWGVVLMLKAASMCEEVEQEVLEAFYARHGFVELRRDEHGYPTMERVPV